MSMESLHISLPEDTWRTIGESALSIITPIVHYCDDQLGMANDAIRENQRHASTILSLLPDAVRERLERQ